LVTKHFFFVEQLQFINKAEANSDFTFSYRQHRVFIARSKLWSTSQWHTVSESTAISFIPRQYSWDYKQLQFRGRLLSQVGSGLG